MAETKKTTTTKKPAAKKASTTAKKPAAKKTAPAAKKPAAKKTTPTKKAPAKKATAKKPVAKKAPEVKVEVKQPEVKVEAPKTASSDVKVYKYLAYIGILWLVGIFVKEKDDKNLRFHVGQGIMLTILTFALSLVVAVVNNFVIYNVFVTKTVFWGYETVVVSGFGLFLAGVLNLAVWAISIFYLVKGIINVRDDKQEELPIIGKYSFYK